MREVDDTYFPTVFHALEQRAMTLERDAVLALIDAERKMRHAIRRLMEKRKYYRDGWIEPHQWDAFETSIKDALSESET